MTDMLDALKTSFLPMSAAILLAVYPVAVLVWTIMEGQAAGHTAKAVSTPQPAPSKDISPAKSTKQAAPPLRTRIHGLQRQAVDRSCKVQWGGICSLQALAVLACGGLVLTGLVGRSLAFVAGAWAGGAGACGGRPQPVAAPPEGARAEPLPSGSGGAEPAAACGAGGAPPLAGGLGVACGAGLLGMAATLRYALRWPASGANERQRRGGRARGKGLRRVASGVLRRCAGHADALHARCEPAGDRGGAALDAAPDARRYALPPDAGASQWHHVSLHVKTWLDEGTELFRYVNEIPRGTLQKFELQTTLAQNVIREDAKGSRRLQAFGRPVPFNYGCFPQTFRDPEELDDLFGAPGDNDPLDVLDLTSYAAGVGEVVCCRVLGAVCLIDEGQADWKVIVVNTAAKDPLSAACSVEEAESVAPGRIEEALRWMDDFKQHSSKSETTLHFEIHDAAKAISIVEKDHAAWKRLLAEVDSEGFARGHWICPAKMEAMGHPQVMPAGWRPRLAAPGQPARAPAPLAGASAPTRAQPCIAAGRALTLRRQTSASSEGGESSASGVSSPLSAGSDLGA